MCPSNQPPEEDSSPRLSPSPDGEERQPSVLPPGWAGVGPFDTSRSGESSDSYRASEGVEAERERGDAEAAVEAELVDDAFRPRPASTAPLRRPRSARRRVLLPLILFGVTCLSTFWAGGMAWAPMSFVEASFTETHDLMLIRRSLIANWGNGLLYMICVLAILVAHEMGHFIATLRYRIPASLPYFLPLPVTPIGTLGAVIGMEGLKANRKEMFDIGVAGPIAGLLVAGPILWVGVQKLDLSRPEYGVFAVDCPLALRLVLGCVQPPGYRAGDPIWSGQLNPCFMAGWVGLLITGLNMLPVSQLDGGHVIYTLFGKRAHWIARGFVLAAILFIYVASAYIWMLMVVLVLLIGTDHPPTRDDAVRLGWFRTALGFASLLIPVLCFPPHGIIMP